MPTSGPGSSGSAAPGAAGRARGFTLIELLVVLAVVAVAAGVISLAFRDSRAEQLEREAERLLALLESARAEARAAGLAVGWVVTPESAETHFRFVGLPNEQRLPHRWLDDRVVARVVGANGLVLGPEAILPAQRVVLRIESQRLALVSDGLSPFAVQPPDERDEP